MTGPVIDDVMKIRPAELFQTSGGMAAQGIPLRFESFDGLPSDDWSGEDIASWGENLHSRFLDWWSAEKDPAVNYTVETYYGI